MKILIAEAKTMRDKEWEIPEGVSALHTPRFERGASVIMELVAGMPVEEISLRVKISMSMASRLFRMAYEFPNKLMGYPAIEAFTGVVFKAFDYQSLSEECKSRTANDLRIISSLYGYLRPEDIIKPYRFDFTTKIAPDPTISADLNETQKVATNLATEFISDCKTTIPPDGIIYDIPLFTFHKQNVTDALIEELQEACETVVLNLLPGDAEKCIDKSRVGRIADIWKIDFKELKENGELKTPNAGRLKTLRGELLRVIIRNSLSHPEELLQIEDDRFLPTPLPQDSKTITFYV